MNSVKRFVAVVIIFMLGACADTPEQSPEEKLKATISSIEESIEQRSVNDIFQHVSDAYKDHKGNDKQALRKIAQLYLFRNQNIELLVDIKSIELIEGLDIGATTAAVEARVLMASKATSQNQSALPLSNLRADAQPVSAVFSLEKENWKLISMSWDYSRAY